MTETRVDLDDYYAAIEALQREITEYRDAASTLQELSIVTLKSHQTNENSAARLSEFVNSAQSQLASLYEALNETLRDVEQLNLSGLFDQLSGRYDTHQARLDELAISVSDAVREQQRLGLQLLQQTTSFQQELTAISAQFRSLAEEAQEQQTRVEQAWKSFSTDLSALKESVLSQIERNAATLTSLDQRLGLQTKLIVAVIILTLAVLVAVLAM
jgi:hypothetical protein